MHFLFKDKWMPAKAEFWRKKCKIFYVYFAPQPRRQISRPPKKRCPFEPSVGGECGRWAAEINEDSFFAFNMLSKGFQRDFKGLSTCFQRAFKWVSKCFQSASKGLSKGFQRGFKGLSKCFQSAYKVLSKCYQNAFSKWLSETFPNCSFQKFY